MLCDLGIKTEVRNKQGKTALLVAANRTSFETLKVRKICVCTEFSYFIYLGYHLKLPCECECFRQ